MLAPPAPPAQLVKAKAATAKIEKKIFFIIVIF
jgi:hypothetical protein